MAELTAAMNHIDNSIEALEEIMRGMCGDNVESELAQIMVLASEKEDVGISRSVALVPTTPRMMMPDEEEDDDSSRAFGMQTTFVNPLDMEHAHNIFVTVTNTVLIKTMSQLKGNLLAEQDALNQKLQELIETKKGGQ